MKQPESIKIMKAKVLLLSLALLTALCNADAQTTVNGRPATQQEKAVARQMVKQGAQMAGKGAQMAVAAVTNPDKAEALSNELERMGEDMERLGDSLESLADDTTFLYAQNDSLELDGDSLGLSADDYDDLIKGFEEGFGTDVPEWAHTWWGKILFGGAGLLIGLLAVVLVVIMLVILFALLTSPLWIIALVVWLIVRATSRDNSTDYMQYQTPHAGQTAAPGQTETADNLAGSTADNYNSSEYTTAPTGQTSAPVEHSALWQKGVTQTCIGVGLAILFLCLGFAALCGIGALVACIGVSKLIIAYSQRKR